MDELNGHPGSEHPDLQEAGRPPITSVLGPGVAASGGWRLIGAWAVLGMAAFDRSLLWTPTGPE